MSDGVYEMGRAMRGHIERAGPIYDRLKAEGRGEEEARMMAWLEAGQQHESNPHE